MPGSHSRSTRYPGGFGPEHRSQFTVDIPKNRPTKIELRFTCTPYMKAIEARVLSQVTTKNPDGIQQTEWVPLRDQAAPERPILKN